MKKSISFIILLIICLNALTQEIYQGRKMQTENLKTVSEIAQPETLPEGAPKHSDVCFSPRWPTTRPGGVPLEVAPKFHTTRLKWMYLDGNTSAFVEQAHQMGYTVSGTVNSVLPDRAYPYPSNTLNNGRARDMNGNFITAPWMPTWRHWGCINNPDFKEIWMEHARHQINMGADNLQMDDPVVNDGGSWKACFCEHCVSGFDSYLSQILTAQELDDLGLSDSVSFDYKQYRIQVRDNADFEQANRGKTSILLEHFKNFQQLSNHNFYVDVHEQLNTFAGREIIYSCNGFGNNSFLHETHQMGMFETYPNREGIPGFLYQERILPMRELGRSFIGTFVTDDIPITRKYISQMYAFGQWMIVPWDVYFGDSPRIFSTPEDYADLYGFVRANAEKLDNYWEAAVAGKDLIETRYDDTPPVHIRRGSLQTTAVVRARPEEPDAPVVIHLVEWSDEPEPFTVVIDPRRFFGDRPVRVTLSTPPAYDAVIHQTAQETKNFSQLSVDTILIEGRFTNIEIPKLDPWGLLTIEPLTEAESPVWQPMIWPVPGSFYSRNLKVHLASPYEGIIIRYTLDGSEPTEESTVYTDILSLEESTTIRAMAFDASGNSSAEAQAQFTYLQGSESIKPDAAGLSADLKLWLRADALSNNLQEGDLVTSWLSSAGPAAECKYIPLFNGAISKPPIFRENIINGMPVVAFEHTTHSLGITNFSNANLAGKQFTIFMLSQSDDNNFGFSGNALNGSGGIPRLYMTRTGMIYDILQNIPSNAPTGKAILNTFGYDGTMLQSWLDTEPQGSRELTQPVSSFGSGNLAMPFWSGNQPHFGQMAEIVIYNRSLSNEERKGVELYLTEKYALPITPSWTEKSSGDPVHINPVQKPKELLNIYPNPGNGRFVNIELPNYDEKEIHIKIYDFKGAEMMSKKTDVTNNNFYVNFDSILKPSIYIVQVIFGNKSLSQKYVVSKYAY